MCERSPGSPTPATPRVSSETVRLDDQLAVLVMPSRAHEVATPQPGVVRRFTAGTFALYRYWAPTGASQKIAKFLSMPEAGKETTVLRHMTVKD